MQYFSPQKTKRIGKGQKLKLKWLFIPLNFFFPFYNRSHPSKYIQCLNPTPSNPYSLEGIQLKSKINHKAKLNPSKLMTLTMTVSWKQKLWSRVLWWWWRYRPSSWFHPTVEITPESFDRPETEGSRRNEQNHSRRTLKIFKKVRRKRWRRKG